MNTNTLSINLDFALPHRPPMRLIDAVIEHSERRIVCKKAFSSDEFFVQGHFPGFPLVPGVILCECALQAGAVLVSTLDGVESKIAAGSVPIVTRMDAVKFKNMVRPGDAVEIEAVLNEVVSNAYYLTGKVTVGGKLAARLDFTCSIADTGGQG